MKILKLGTRGSKLALWQAEAVSRMLQLKAPETAVDIKVIHTKGDKVLDMPLSKIGDKGLFTKEIENELLNGYIDMAVHSMKDMSSELDENLMIAAVLEREDPRDVLISDRGFVFSSLPAGARIGTSSLRRIAQVRAIRPDVNIVEIRGNVETRINKMHVMGLDAIIMAYAGVKRLGLETFITDVLDKECILPAAAQGAIAVETRTNDPDIINVLKKINDVPSMITTLAERSFLRTLEGGCQVPIACLAEVKEGIVNMDGLVASLDGTRVYRNCCSGRIDEAERLGYELARQLLNSGAAEILKEIKEQGN